MSPPPPAFRCAAASLLRDEPVAGTATQVRAWLLVEHTGPWGADALLDARLPEGVGPALKDRARALRAKILLIRRFSSTSDGAGVRVFAALADPVRPRIEAGRLGDVREVLDLDLAGFRDGGSTGLSAYDSALFCVCTNGRHDACCAERGRPIARALDRAHPEETWEVSHIGGDRFAGNLVVLPQGLYYGRLDPAAALAVAGAHLAGELDLDHLRGRSSQPMAVQAAEILLRRELGATREPDVVLVGRSVEADLTTAVFAVAGATYDVRVRTTRDPATATQLTCKARRANPVPAHELLSVTRRV
ncbi:MULTISPECIES: sucrase ferredoxin [unclassified Nocardioides]|uniref:sucrase ferredoxin n=1 Tax=unclassified Nocardioides TaxID=2615069 RepID=UPI0000EB6405|nr:MULTISPECIES: sucrase ferredoxin [unclassified Nocardioides]ABL83874.1 Sucraseferredoxin family protein [Nocardioides sp. JS614]